MTKPMALSYSRLNTFEQCEQRFYYQYVAKSVQDQGSSATEYGTRVHSVLEEIGKLGTADAPDVVATMQGTEEARSTAERWGPLALKVAQRPGDKHFEHQMAVNRNLEPVSWFSPDVWLRSIADVLVVNNDTAHCLDYKTGKVKEDFTQLQLFAAMTMWQYPKVERVKVAYLWLAHDTTTSAQYERRYLGALWRALEPRFTRVQEVIDLGTYKTKPSPLCKWCPARGICPDAR